MATEWLNVSDTTPRIAYTATSGQTAFTVPFVFFVDEDLFVYQNAVLLTLATDYTVSGAETSPPAGRVTLLTGATVGDAILITRNLAIVQTTHIPPSGPLDIPAINIQISKLVAISQQLDTRIDRSFSLPDSDGDLSVVLPAASDRANKAVAFDAAGHLVMTDVVAGGLIPDAANISYTPAGAGAVITTVEAKLREISSGADTGIVPNTGGDLGPALQAAIDSLPTGNNGGGEIVLSAGTFLFSTPFNLDGRTNIRIRGQGTQTGGAQSGTALRFTGTGFVDAISMGGQNVGCSFKDIELAYNNPLFTGHLVSIGNGAAAGTGSQRFENVTFADDSAAHTAEALVYLGGGSQDVTFKNVTFNGGSVRGRDAADADHFANVVNFHMCAFIGNDTPPIEFGGEAWKFDTCNFEPLAGGGVGAYAGSALVPAIGVTFDNCWFGDATVSGTWVAYSGTGLVVTGGRMGANHSGSQYGIRLTGAEGNTIYGVSFEGLTAAIDFDNSAVDATSVFNNKFITCDAEIANFASRGGGVVCYANSPRTELDPAVGSVTWNPPSLTTGTQTNTAVTVTGALVGDLVEISFNLALQGLVLSGYVSGVDTVFVNLRNDTGGTVDLGSGTLRVRASKW